eukprot:2740870-Rhodomonas_salina.6
MPTSRQTASGMVACPAACVAQYSQRSLFLERTLASILVSTSSRILAAESSRLRRRALSCASSASCRASASIVLHRTQPSTTAVLFVARPLSDQDNIGDLVERKGGRGRTSERFARGAAPYAPSAAPTLAVSALLFRTTNAATAPKPAMSWGNDHKDRTEDVN